MEKIESNKTGVCLNDLVQAARREKWELVDATLPSLADNPKVVGWALRSGMSSKNGNVRDLAVSILEKSSCELKPENKERLLRLLRGDENPYVQFRAAFTLFNRGDRSGVVVDKLYEATGHEDVCQIAQGYLAQLQP